MIACAGCYLLQIAGQWWWVWVSTACAVGQAAAFIKWSHERYTLGRK